MSHDTKPLILLANDDGVRAEGLHALFDAVGEFAHVVAVAPEHEQSAHSHSITLGRPLRHRVHKESFHAIDGTPADCIYIALYRKGILPRWPDLVLSGINHGPNLGSDVFYSGTVAAAREAALRGIPAIAFSASYTADMEQAAKVARDVTWALLERLHTLQSPVGQALLLSVNFPPEPYVGVRSTRLGKRLYRDEVIVRQDPRGRDYYWLGGDTARHEPMPGCDTQAYDDGFVSITPLLLEASSEAHMPVAEALAQSLRRA